MLKGLKISTILLLTLLFSVAFNGDALATDMLRARVKKVEFEEKEKEEEGSIFSFGSTSEKVNVSDGGKKNVPTVFLLPTPKNVQIFPFSNASLITNFEDKPLSSKKAPLYILYCSLKLHS